MWLAVRWQEVGDCGNSQPCPAGDACLTRLCSSGSVSAGATSIISALRPFRDVSLLCCAATAYEKGEAEEESAIETMSAGSGRECLPAGKI